MALHPGVFGAPGLVGSRCAGGPVAGGIGARRRAPRAWSRGSVGLPRPRRGLRSSGRAAARRSIARGPAAHQHGTQPATFAQPTFAQPATLRPAARAMGTTRGLCCVTGAFACHGPTLHRCEAPSTSGAGGRRAAGRDRGAAAGRGRRRSRGGRCGRGSGCRCRRCAGGVPSAPPAPRGCGGARDRVARGGGAPRRSRFAGSERKRSR